MGLSRSWIILLLGIGRIIAGLDLQLVRSRRPTESLPLDLTCQSSLRRTATMRIFKNEDSQFGCTTGGSCASSVYNNYTMNSTSITLTIQALDYVRDGGIWSCSMFGSPVKISNNVSLENIASLLNFDALSFNPSLTSFTAVRPDQSISVTIGTPCTKPAPVFIWKYRQNPSGSFAGLGSTFNSTSESASGCTSDQKKYTNTLTLPGNTVSFYNKKLSMRVEVEHDSFDPTLYIKYRDSGSIQFPVRVLSVSLSPNNLKQNMFEGESFTFVCTTSASFPQATVAWYKERTTQPTQPTQLPETSSSTSPSSGVIVTTTSRLTYKATRTDHGLKIYCRASNSVTIAVMQSNYVELNIFYPPNKPVITGFTEICPGRQTSLTCLSSDPGNPPANYKWTRNSNTVSIGSVWTFTPSKVDNGANIGCSAGNTYTDRQGYSRVQSDPTTLKVYYTPVLTVTGDLTMREGQDLSLICSSDPQDAAVTWSPSGTGQGSTLTISNLSRADDRDYTCHGGFTQACTHLQNSTVVHVVVNYAPDIVDYKPVTIDEGQTLKLSCEVDGRPSQYEFKPFVQYWGDQQVDSRRGDQNGEEYTWSTNGATYLDTGECECNVNNGIPDRNNILDQKKRVQVLVRGKPVATSDSSQEASGEIGSTIHLFQTFYTSGLIITSYNWTHNNLKVIGANSAIQRKVALEKNGVKFEFDGLSVTLTIPDFRLEGIYTVTVCNTLGCTSANVNVIAAVQKQSAASSSSAGAIVGGVVGCVVVIIVVVIVVVLVLRHRRHQAGGSSNSSRTPSRGNQGTVYDTLGDRTNSPTYAGAVHIYQNTTQINNQAYENIGQKPAVEYEGLEFNPYENT